MRMRGPSWIAIVSLSAVGVVLFAEPVAAQQEPKIKHRVMQEPGDVVDVLDAFDDDNGDPYDFSASLTFQYLSKRARILREATLDEPGLTSGGYTAQTQNVGRYIETTSKLTPRIELGIFKDLAFFVAVPIVLSNSRRIDDLDGTANNPAVAVGGPGETLFTVPFQAPDRSGVEHVALGLNFSIFNQARDYTKPTWVFGVEGRISAGEPMHACNASPKSDQQICAQPGDINRDRIYDGDSSFEAINAGDERDAGVTRGTFGLRIHSVMSKRIKYIEPYGGFSAMIEFQQGESDYGQSDLAGALVNHPPLIGNVMLGMMIHPWENREKFSRLSFDLRFEGEYHSEGRDYAELFDALGSSDAASLRNPKWARFTANTETCPDPNNCPLSVVDQGSQMTYFTGLSVVEPYGSYRTSGSVTWRASEYIKLQAGVGLRFEQAHGISHDQPCNPDFDGGADEAGPCHADLPGNLVHISGQPNPAYRRTINAVGRRFYVDESMTYEVFASGVVLF